jgi:uncharacterized membrane protein
MNGRGVARVALGLFLVAAGVAHLVAPDPFLAQTPTFLPARRTIVLVSGLVEIALGVALLVVRRRRAALGWIVAAFFVAILPGNVHQAVAGVDAFGLNSPAARWTRVGLQPLLVWWAWWATRPSVGGGRRSPGRTNEP